MASITQRTSPGKCTEDGCDRPIHSRGMCAPHYGIWYRRTKAKHTYTCGLCGTESTTGRKSTAPIQYCCQDHARKGSAKVRERVYKGSELELWRPPTQFEPQRLFMVGACIECGDQFTAWAYLAHKQPTDKYCSRRCSRMASWRRRYRSRGEFSVPEVFRQAIYERDNWTCQICHEPVDPDVHYLEPMAPTLDHIEPQSWALIPDHSASNLRLAHRICNLLRGNMAVPARR